MKRLFVLNFIALIGLCISAQAENIVDTITIGRDSSATAKKVQVVIATTAPHDYGFSHLFSSIDNGTGPQLNPQAIGFVKDYVDYHGKSLLQMKDWAIPYFNMIDEVFEKNGIPPELKYLAVIESRLKSNAVSWAGAVGPWQFMPATARNMGLIVNKKIDERTDYVKSTQAAAKYLSSLYNIFGDWLLVIAAYNCGTGNVQRAMRLSGSDDFWELQYNLPAETRNHVKKFIGTHYVFEGQGGLTTLTKSETEDFNTSSKDKLVRKLTTEELNAAKTISVAGKYFSTVIAKYTNMDIKEFNRYNPSFDKIMGINNSYELKLPEDKMQLFTSNKYQILNESVQIMLNNSNATAGK